MLLIFRGLYVFIEVGGEGRGSVRPASIHEEDAIGRGGRSICFSAAGEYE